MRGFTMIGLLVSVACICVLLVLLMNSIGTAKGGPNQPSNLPNTISTGTDTVNLTGLYQSMAVHADNRDRLMTPQGLSGRLEDNTTANLFSAMVIGNYMTPERLVSSNDRNGWVEEDTDYNFHIYDAAAGIYWDPSFTADLEIGSNVSYGHLPLIGTRYTKRWTAFGSSSYPLLGYRGPRNGTDGSSVTLADDGSWAGVMAFADGSVRFVDSMEISAQAADGSADNMFKPQDGPLGADAVIAFTEAIDEDGPTLQFD